MFISREKMIEIILSEKAIFNIENDKIDTLISMLKYSINLKSIEALNYMKMYINENLPASSTLVQFMFQFTIDNSKLKHYPEIKSLVTKPIENIAITESTKKEHAVASIVTTSNKKKEQCELFDIFNTF